MNKHATNAQSIFGYVDVSGDWYETDSRESAIISADNTGGTVGMRHVSAVIQLSNSAHLSDCSTHNEPAYPNGPCDCGRVRVVLDTKEGE